jgi:hypothetical protein
MQKICQRLFYRKQLAAQRRILLFIYSAAANENYSLLEETEYLLPSFCFELCNFYSEPQ